MRFRVLPHELAQSWTDWRQAYLSGVDGRIFPTRLEFSDDQFVCRRSQNDSGKLSVPWPVKGFGCPIVTTASLNERETPYLLPLELARGKLSDVRDQSAAWELNRMAIPDAYRETQREAFRAFAKASAKQAEPDVAGELANQAIRLAFEAAHILLGAYTVQRMASIRKTARHAAGLLGTMLDESALEEPGRTSFCNTFDTACIRLDWKSIEPEEGKYDWHLPDQLVRFCTDHRKILRGGPLIDLGPDGLPDWLAPWKNDVLNLPSFICDFVDTVIGRYAGLIRIWEVSASGNTGGALDLSEEHRLSIVARTLEAAIKKDADSQFFLRIDQPWGEYRREGRHRLSPFQFVDAIIRSSLGLTGVSLNLSVGYDGGGSHMRDLLSISRLIDIWSLLGIQIHVNLACPSSGLPDLHADQTCRVINSWRAPWSAQQQAEWMDEVVPMLLSKPAVTGVFLQQFSDAVPHRLPHAGALDGEGNSKPLLDVFRRQRGVQTLE
ncbi:MAG: endo-1,4-beta-xylanase [Planctomycetaceae bacterium]|nr:endo-1,4-beta-xylanase [Planctomycetaceae bacterium]